MGGDVMSRQTDRQRSMHVAVTPVFCFAVSAVDDPVTFYADSLQKAFKGNGHQR